MLKCHFKHQELVKTEEHHAGRTQKDGKKRQLICGNGDCIIYRLISSFFNLLIRWVSMRLRLNAIVRQPLGGLKTLQSAPAESPTPCLSESGTTTELSGFSHPHPHIPTNTIKYKQRIIQKGAPCSTSTEAVLHTSSISTQH